MNKGNKAASDQEIRNLAAKEVDKAVKELQGESRPADDGIKTKERNI